MSSVAGESVGVLLGHKIAVKGWINLCPECFRGSFFARRALFPAPKGRNKPDLGMEVRDGEAQRSPITTT